MTLTYDTIYDKTVHYLNELSKNPYYEDIYTNILNKYEACLIGGAIRDFCFDSQPKDLDFVINIPDKELIKIISKYNYKKNKFNGYKISINHIFIDIWSIENHWAFKNKILAQQIDNLEYTTFYNFDSLVYNLYEKKLYADCFLEGYHSKLLDITLNNEYLEINPGKISNVYKAFKLANEWNLNFSDTTIAYLRSWKNSCPSSINQLIKYEESTTSDTELSKKFMSYLEQI